MSNRTDLDTHKKLDELLCNYMTLHRERDDVHAAMEQAQRDGYLFMSQARIAMGQAAVSKLQYDAEPQALVHATVKCGELDEVLIEVADNDQVIDATDPLRWFSVIPPPALKSCQARFNLMIRKAADVATLQVRMHNTRKEYAKLKQELKEA